MSKKIIVRADDLGYCEAVNYGIAKTIRDGIIRSAGLMPNMPDAAHGVALMKDLPVCLGQHTNICLGTPICSPEEIPSLCQPNGNFKPSCAYRAASKEGIDFVVLEEVVREIDAQYHRFVELTGRQPGYFEGHAVASPNFFKGLELVAKRYNLPYLATSYPNPAVFRGKQMYASMDSMLPNYNPFESLQKAAMKNYGEDGILMFICHPGYMDEYLLNNSSLTIPRVQEVTMACSPLTKKWLAENDIEVISFDMV